MTNKEKVVMAVRLKKSGAVNDVILAPMKSMRIFENQGYKMISEKDGMDIVNFLRGRAPRLATGSGDVVFSRPVFDSEGDQVGYNGCLDLTRERECL